MGNYVGLAALTRFFNNLKTNYLDTYATITALAEKYTKPSGGVPKTDMASDVQASLTLADGALQSSAVSAWAKASTKPSYEYTEITGACTVIDIDVTLDKDDWSSTSPFTQTIESTATSQVLESDIPLVDVDRSGMTASNAEDLLSAWGSIQDVETKNGYLIVRCFQEKPTEDVGLKVKIIRRQSSDALVNATAQVVGTSLVLNGTIVSGT